MKNVFSSILMKRPKRSMFDLSYDHKLSFKMGYLVPVHVQEVVPTDKFTMSAKAMFRMSPLVAPIMHKVDAYMHFFFVPNRILWPNWEKFITGGDDPDVGIPAFPTIDVSGLGGSFDVSSLADYLGVPPGVDLAAAGVTDISALPFAAYLKIWDDYYRDQNLIPSEWEELTDGVQSLAYSGKLTFLRKRAWEHDYFTACLPWPQKGDAVTIPIDMYGNGPNGWLEVFENHQNGNSQLFKDNSGNPYANVNVNTDGDGALTDGTNPGWIDPNETLWVDPADASGLATLNDLRTASALQRWLEKNARGGSRYFESMLVHFGLKSPDSRLQRPEYLGGSKASVAISEVLQTSSTDSTSPQGNMAGHGVSISSGKNFSYYCQEHGYIIGLLSVRPRTAYMQGLPRHFSKTVDRTQFYWPDFAHLGEQAVLNKELYINDVTPAYNDQTFGYIPRYSEYRYNAGRVSGQFRTSLDTWHMARKFATPPSLNRQFVEMDPTKRVFAVTDPNEDEILAHIYHEILASRPMPIQGNPGSI